MGPIREAQLLATESLPECEAGCDINGLADMVDFVRQWAQVSPVQSMSGHVRLGGPHYGEPGPLQWMSWLRCWLAAPLM